MQFHVRSSFQSMAAKPIQITSNMTVNIYCPQKKGENRVSFLFYEMKKYSTERECIIFSVSIAPYLN